MSIKNGLNCDKSFPRVCYHYPVNMWYVVMPNDIAYLNNDGEVRGIMLRTLKNRGFFKTRREAIRCLKKKMPRTKFNVPKTRLDKRRERDQQGILYQLNQWNRILARRS